MAETLACAESSRFCLRAVSPACGISYVVFLPGNSRTTLKRELQRALRPCNLEFCWPGPVEFSLLPKGCFSRMRDQLRGISSRKLKNHAEA